MEIERKFAPVPPGAFEALLRDGALAGCLGRPQSKSMRTVYYDVPGCALGRAGFMLRLRQEGEGSVCCLKGPSDAQGGRLELETPAGTIAQGLSALMALPGFPPEAAGILHMHRPEPRCSAAFTRTSRAYDDGALAFVLCHDVGQAEGAGRKAGIDEIELEYLRGDLARFFALCDALAARHNLRESHITKAKRAFALLEE